MTRQWAVVVRPEVDQTVRALGPIATRARAERIVDRLEAWEDSEAGGSVFGLSLLAQAVELESVADFMRKIGESEPTEPPLD